MDDATRTIPLTQGQEALVDADDYERLMKWKWLAIWSPGHGSFVAARASKLRTAKEARDTGKPRQRMVYMAREILGLDRGSKMQADHINHQTLDNRRSNLRIVTSRQNKQNRRGFRTSTSRFKGVSWDDRINKWVSQISSPDGVKKRLGAYEDEIAAAKEYDRASIMYFGEFGYTNFPNTKELENAV